VGVPLDMAMEAVIVGTDPLGMADGVEVAMDLVQVGMEAQQGEQAAQASLEVMETLTAPDTQITHGDQLEPTHTVLTQQGQ